MLHIHVLQRRIAPWPASSRVGFAHPARRLTFAIPFSQGAHGVRDGVVSVGVRVGHGPVDDRDACAAEGEEEDVHMEPVGKRAFGDYHR